LYLQSSAINNLGTGLSFLIDEQGEKGQEGSTEQFSGKFADCGGPVIFVPASAVLGSGTGNEDLTVGIGCICNCGQITIGNRIIGRSEETGLGVTISIGIVTFGDDGSGTEVGSTCTLSAEANIAGRDISGAVGGRTLKLMTVSDGSACGLPGLHASWSGNSAGSSLNKGVTVVILLSSS
jgi:hypothetical protein